MNNIVILTGKICDDTPGESPTFSSFFIKAGDFETFLYIPKGMYFPAELRGKKIRVFGVLKRDKHLDDCISVVTYQLLNYQGNVVKEAPDWWKGFYPSNHTKKVDDFIKAVSGFIA